MIAEELSLSPAMSPSLKSIVGTEILWIVRPQQGAITTVPVEIEIAVVFVEVDGDAADSHFEEVLTV